MPTRRRAGYLDVALASIAPQAAAAGAELLVVDDGPDEATRDAAERHGARYVAHPASRGLNAARNSGIDAARSDLFVFVDDDVAVRPGWLDGADRRRRHGRSRGRRADGADPRPLRGPSPALVRPREPADHDPGLRPRRPRRRARLGREHDAAPQRDRRDSAPSTPSSRPARATRRPGSSACSPRAGGFATSPPPRWTIAAPATTRGCARSPAPRSPAERRRAASTRRRAARPRCGARSRCCSAAPRTRSATRCANGIVLTAHSLGRLRARARRPGRLARPGLSVGRERHRARAAPPAAASARRGARPRGPPAPAPDRPRRPRAPAAAQRARARRRAARAG